MNDIDIPILKKTSDLYKLFHEYRKVIPKQDRFTIYERSEDALISALEYLLEAGYTKPASKTLLLEQASVKMNTFRFFVRLLKETHSIDSKKYLALQEPTDEIGRMLGGWIRSAGK